MSVNCSVSNHLDNLINILGSSESLGVLESALVEYLQKALPDATDTAVLQDLVESFNVLGADANVRAALIGMGSLMFKSWLSPETTTNWVLDRIHPGEISTQDDSSKIDAIDPDTEQEEINRLNASFLMKAYGGNSTAKSDLLRRFDKFSTNMFFVRMDGGGEITTQEDLEFNIITATNQIYSSLRKAAIALDLPGAKELPTKIMSAEEHITKKNWEKYKSVTANWGQILDSKPAEINDTAIRAISGDTELKNMLEVFQGNFILTNFDQLLQTKFKDSYKIVEGTAGQFGITHKGIHKYQKADNNTKMRSSWVSNDEEQTNALKETSEHVRAFFDSMMITSIDPKIAERSTSMQEIASTWTDIKARIRISDPIRMNKDIGLTELKKYFTPREMQLLQQQILPGDDSVSLQALMSNASADPEIMRLLVKVLGYDGESPLVDMVGFNKSQRSIFHSLYKAIFAEDSPLYKAFVASQKNPVVGKAPKSYYEWFGDFFGNLSQIEMSQLRRDPDQSPRPTTLGANSLDSGAYIYKGHRDAAFSAKVDYKGKDVPFVRQGKTYTVDPTTLNPKDKVLDIVLNDGTIVRRNGNGAVSIINTAGDTVKVGSIPVSSPLFKSLQDFYFEVLGLDHYQREQASAALGDAGLDVRRLLDLATDIIYNYSVSYNLMGKTLSKKGFLDEAAKYFPEDVGKSLKLQRDGSELDSVSRRNTGNLTSLVKVTDFLEGRIRSTVAKSADGTSINTISTSQLAYSAYDQWMRGRQQKNYACSDFSLFDAYKGLEFARDVAWGDQNKRVSAFSEAEMFGRSFIAGYLAPVYSPADSEIERVFRVIPLVVSDKVRIPDLKIDMEALSPIKDEMGNNKRWMDCTEKDLRQAAIKEIGGYYAKAYAEFGKRFGYLQAALTSPQFTGRISSFGSDSANADVDFYLTRLMAGTSQNLGYSEGFTDINTITQEFVANKVSQFVKPFGENASSFDRTSPFFEFIRDFALEQTHKTGLSFAEVITNLKVGQEAEGRTDGKFAKEIALFQQLKEAYNEEAISQAKNAVSNVLHELTARARRMGNPVVLPVNSSYVVGGDARIYVNPVLVDQLYRWGTISAAKAQSLLPFYFDKKAKVWVQAKLSSGEGTADQFFEHKTKQTLKNILQDGGSVVLSGPSLKAAGEENFFPEGSEVQTKSAFGGSYVLGVITYQSRDAEGNVKTFTEHLINRSSFENSYILKQAFNFLKYQSGDGSFNYSSASEWFQSTDFKFEDFEAAATQALALHEKLIRSKAEFDKHWEGRRIGLENNLTQHKNKQIAKFNDKIKAAQEKLETALRDNNERDARAAKQDIEHYLEERDNYEKTQELYIKERLNDLDKAMKEERKKFKELKKNSPEITDTTVKVHVNPNLAKFNTLSFLFGQEYTIATVGSHINHPGMKSIGNGLIAMEALCFQQQTKRNVSLTATKNKYHLNRWNSLRDHHKICIISNTKDDVYNLTGTQDDVFNDDGACYTAGVTHYWENASLGPNAVGIDKKTFFHMHDSGLGTGYIGKDAGFTANNDRVRSSLFYAYLNYRMLNDPDGDLARYMQGGGLDITHRYGFPSGGEKIAFSDFAYEKVIVRDKNGESVEQLNLNLEGGEDIPEHAVINVLGNSIEFDPNTGLTHFQAQVYFDGNVTVRDLAVRITNVHDIWKFFGGAYSGKMSADGTIKQEDYNDQSTQYTAEICNLVGERINGTGPDEIISSQSQVNQYLKNSVVVYMPTVESVKQGASGVNDVTQLANFDYVMTTTDMDLHDSGVQLNAEHHADDTVISMMTQVLNALGARGYTATEGDRTYQALRALTETNLKGYMDGVRNLRTGEAPSEEARASITNFIAQIITKTIRSADLDDGTLVAALTFQARNALEQKSGNLNYEEIMQYIPIDDLGLLRSEMSKIASALVKSCIRVKFPGSMDVLSPSNGRFLLYDGKLMDQYKGDLSSLKTEDDKAMANHHRNTHAIKLGTTYRLSLGESSDLPTQLSDFLLGDVNPDGTVDVKVNTPTEYWALQDFVARNDDVYISEVFSAGRDLAAYGVTFMTKEPAPRQFQIWDLVAIQDLYNQTLVGTREQRRAALQELQAALSSLSNDPNFTEAEVRVFDAASQKWVKEKVQIDKKSVNVSPYEVIMSMHDQEQFGLRVGDDVKTISDNKLFFLERFVEDDFKNEGENDKYFDFELRSIDRKNRVWLSLGDKPVDRNYFTPVANSTFIDDSDPDNPTVWQVNFAGEKVRRLASANDKVYVGAAGETLIVTNSPEFYLEGNSHVSMTISTRVAERDPDTLIKIFDEHLIHCDSRNVKGFLKRFKMRLDNVTEDEVDEDEVDTSELVGQMQASRETVAKELADFITVGRQTFINSINEVKRVLAESGTPESKLAQLVGRGPDGKHVVADGRVRNLIDNTLETHTSFLKSLEVLAARIPAQCMQSFMAMKIVGFDRSGVNTAYVSRFQIYLQGSDFDIDKVSLLGFKFRNGKFVTWSPFMDISSIENLEASLNIPFPTGRAFNAVEDSTARCSLGDSILYGLHPGVRQGVSGLEYVMTDASGNVLYSLIPHKEIDSRYQELPTESELWSAFNAFASESNPETLSQTLQQFASDTYMVNGVLLKVSEFIPEDIMADIEAGDDVDLRKLRTAVLDGVKEAAHKYTDGAPIKGYELVLNTDISNADTRAAIQRSLAYITQEGQTILVDENAASMLSEYGFDVNGNEAVRSQNNISAARDFLNFILSHSGNAKSGKLFIREKGKFTLNTGANYKGNKEQLLKDLGTFIQAVNEFEGIPQFTEPQSSQETAYNESIDGILKEVNRHNLSLSRNSKNLQDALINFISTSMYAISKNPINQIQAQSSVDASDGAVNVTKELAKQSEYSKKLLEFNPGSITSIYRMTKLTLGGKTNVGITASSLKTFEGLTQYTYNVLNHGTAERIAALLTDKVFAGQRVRMMANPYQQNKQNFLPFDVYLALQEAAERSDLDAYLWFSGILSLSTDNAKDPTMVKINAGEKMLAIYLAGLAVGIDMHMLIPIMTSRAGILINSLMESNIFTGNSGLFDVNAVINYIDKPEEFIRTLSDKSLEVVYNQYAKIAYAGTKKIPSFERKALNDSQFIGYFIKNADRILTQEIGKANLKDDDKARIRRDLRKFNEYDNTTRTIKNCSIEYEGESYSPYYEIKKLNAVLQEMRIFSQIGRLNQTLPNTIADQIVWKDKFEKGISKRIDSMSAKEKNTPAVKKARERLKELNNSIGLKEETRIDFMNFVENPEYRQGIIEVYDALKVVVNPYAAMSELAHYFGYMQTAAALFRVNESSNIYKTTEYITKNVVKVTGTPDQKTKQITRILDWINDNLTANYLRQAVAPIKISLPEGTDFEVYTKTSGLQMNRKPIQDTSGTIVLGSEEGNATFKVLMEEVIIPRLQEEQVNNPLLTNLTETKFDKTYDKNFIIKYATTTSGSPNADFEKESLSKYKSGLHSLTKVTIKELGGMSAIDALFLYNLIVNSGKVGQTTLSMVFEDYAISQGRSSEEFSGYSSDLIAGYYDSRKMQESELLEEITRLTPEAKRKLELSMAVEDAAFTTGAMYIIHQNPETRNYEILYNKRKADEKAKANSNSEDESDLAAEALAASGISEEDYQIREAALGDEYEEGGRRSYAQVLEKEGYVVVGALNSGKLARALITPTTITSESLNQFLYENPMTGEIRIKDGGKLIKYKDLLPRMTPEARQRLEEHKVTDMKGLLKLYGFIKGTKTIEATAMLEALTTDKLIESLTNPQC